MTRLMVAFFCSGFAALLCQIIWQRMLGVFAGSDTVSAALVVGAFLAGLGLGSIIGARLADRLSPYRALLGFALCEAGVAICALISKFFLYDFIAIGLADFVEQPAAIFALCFAGLVIPTTLMGASLPLLARAIATDLATVASRIGTLYSLNTLGAGLGALIGGWFIMGSLGFVTALIVAAGLDLVAAALALTLLPGLSREKPAAPSRSVALAPEPFGGMALWCLLVFLSGYDVVNRKLIVNEDEAPRVRRVFEIFAETGSGVETVRRLQAEGATSKTGRPLDKGDVYKLLHNRTYVGEAAHKGQVYPGEHQAIVPRDLWDRAHAVLQISPRVRANQNRAQTPALLKGLIFGVDGRALSPTHARKNGRLYRYYVAQRVLKGDAAGDDSIVRRVSAAEIEAAVVDQVRALLRQPEIVVGTWRAAHRDAPELTEAETQDALHRLDPLWEHLFPAEQARIVRSLAERVVVGPAGADIRLRLDGLGSLVRDLGAIVPDALRAAA